MAKTSRTKVHYSFSRADALDRTAIERLIASLTRLLGHRGDPGPGGGPGRVQAVGIPSLEFTDSRPLDGAWVLDGLWHRLGVVVLLRKLAAGARRDPVVERALFALVANRTNDGRAHK